jgi:dTDP-4-dehydrorhamnose 3,5-epimerase
MNFIETELPEVVIIEPRVFNDDRGYFFESFRDDLFKKHIGDINFVPDNESYSSFGTLRGLHYQLPPFAQSKLVRVIKGKVLDVAVDIRKGSDTFGKHVAIELSEENKRQLFIPRGFAHAFLVLSQKAVFQYKVDNHYSKEHERGISFSDPEIGITWPVDMATVTLSAKDQLNPSLSEADLFEGSRYE